MPVAESLPTPTGQPLLVPLSALCEDPDNPRTEFPQAELQELAEDIRQHGILQPIVVQPADADGRYRIHFGAKRFRAASLAGLAEVPVTVRPKAADPYAQVAENQKRHGLSPLDLARFIRSRVELGATRIFIGKPRPVRWSGLFYSSLSNSPTFAPTSLPAPAISVVGQAGESWPASRPAPRLPS